MVEELHRYLPEEELTVNDVTSGRKRISDFDSRKSKQETFFVFEGGFHCLGFFGIETNSFHIQEQTLERTKMPTRNVNMNLSQLVCSRRISSNEQRETQRVLLKSAQWNVC